VTRTRIYEVVRRIPRGRVATYGQIAALAGLPGHARQVGYALNALPPGTALPWHRVINARGQVSRRAVPGEELSQRMLLEQEGVRFDGRGRVALARVQWRPRKWSTCLAALVLALLTGCSGAGDRSGNPAAGQRQRDSAIGASGLPGAQGVQGALRASDSAAARRAREDSSGVEP
jgi:methylated-DNA-protein-cysteine methyltransferase-like protein